MLGKGKGRKVTAVVSAILVIVLSLGIIIYALRDAIFVYTVPKIYAFMKVSNAIEEIKDEFEFIEDRLINDDRDYDDDITISFWNYTDSENDDKKGDLSFDLSVSEKKKRFEFAYDNTKAKKMKDLFLYIDNNEIGVNFADFSDDYWVNDGRYAVSDYNNSALREILGKEKIRGNYNLSFNKIVSGNLLDKVSKKEAVRSFLSSLTFEKREVVSFNKNEYKLFFSQTKKNTEDFLNIVMPFNWGAFFDGENVNMCVHTQSGQIKKITVDFSQKYSFDISFSDLEKYLEGFSLKLLINDKDNKNEITLSSKGNRFKKGEFTDETTLSFTSSLGNRIYIKNSFKLLKNDVNGEFVYGINEDKTSYYYNGIFDTTDGILLDLQNVKSENTKTEAGIYIDNKFTSVIRKIGNKKEILHMNKDELINYAKKTGGEDITRLFE